MAIADETSVVNTVAELLNEHELQSVDGVSSEYARGFEMGFRCARSQTCDRCFAELSMVENLINGRRLELVKKLRAELEARNH